MGVGEGGGISIRDPDPNPPRPQPPDIHVFLSRRPHYTRFTSNRLRVKFVRVKLSCPGEKVAIKTSQKIVCYVGLFGHGVTKHGQSMSAIKQLKPMF